MITRKGERPSKDRNNIYNCVEVDYSDEKNAVLVPLMIIIFYIQLHIGPAVIQS